ncbi:MAG: hypothetical protein JWM18_4933 [Chloroflexi bacterium]|jgi:hypothetical protein|nr:hypothetical protein [Chloroflexota bacterium]
MKRRLLRLIATDERRQRRDHKREERRTHRRTGGTSGAPGHPSADVRARALGELAERCAEEEAPPEGET